VAGRELIENRGAKIEKFFVIALFHPSQSAKFHPANVSHPGAALVALGAHGNNGR